VKGRRARPVRDWSLVEGYLIAHGKLAKTDAERMITFWLIARRLLLRLVLGT
jgi:hypothetical protein